MTESLPPIDALLVTIVLATLSIGLPIITVLAIRFLWERKLNLGRSKELEKLIWQLHRIASALEHQMNLSFPAVQPGTEEPRDLMYLKQAAVPAQTGAPNAAAPVNFQEAALPAAAQAASPATAQAAAPAAPQAGARESATPQPPAAQATPPPSPPGQRRPAPPDAPHARVNSMFGFDK
jgi:hypothetical protein